MQTLDLSGVILRLLRACIIKTGLDRPWIDLAFYITYWGSTLAMKKLKNI
jgi:hypothetical protein